ncbi:hypothetical protein [Arthrobacter sp. TMN-50]
MSDQEHTPRGSASNPEQDSVEAPRPEPVGADEVQPVDLDTMQPRDADVSPEGIEPELTVTADDVELVEPSLSPAQISEDAARDASLEETAAEARRVEQEALDAGQLVAGAGSVVDPTAAAASAGGAAGDTEGESSPEAPGAEDGNDDAVNTSNVAPTAVNSVDGNSGDSNSGDADDNDGHPSESGLALPSFAADGDAPLWTAAATDEERWDRLFHDADPESDADAPGPAPAVSAAADPDADAPAIAVPTTDPAGLPGGAAEPQGSYPELPPEQSTEPAGGPYGLPPAGTQPVRRRDGRQAAGKGQRKKGLLIGGALLGLLALGLLIWGLVSLIGGLTSAPDKEPISNGTPGADGIIAENVLPIDIEAGQCLRDFVDINTGSTVVTCSTPHNAQLLATEFYADGDEFPGEDALALRAQEVCDGVDLDEGAVSRYENLELLRVTPQQNAWSDGDRRVDCLVTSSEGNVISDTLITD